jgi:hypothetical protein
MYEGYLQRSCYIGHLRARFVGVVMLTQDGKCIVTLFRQMQARRREGFSESFYVVAGDFKIKANRDVRKQLEINDPPTA